MGRELYSCPFVWVNLNPNEWKANAYGKSQPRVKFHVSDIAYDDNRNVSRLVIKDDKGIVRLRSVQVLHNSHSPSSKQRNKHNNRHRHSQHGQTLIMRR